MAKPTSFVNNRAACYEAYLRSGAVALNSALASAGAAWADDYKG